jgi:hypothetical protein
MNIQLSLMSNGSVVSNINNCKMFSPFDPMLHLLCSGSHLGFLIDTNHFVRERPLNELVMYLWVQSNFWVFFIFTLGFYNMKPARPWMLAHLKIIWQFHAHPVHQKVSRFFGPRYIGDDYFLGPNLVSFNRAVVPLFELSFLAKSQKLTSA